MQQPHASISHLGPCVAVPFVRGLQTFRICCRLTFARRRPGPIYTLQLTRRVARVWPTTSHQLIFITQKSEYFVFMFMSMASCPWPWLTHNLQLDTRTDFRLRGHLALVGSGVAGLDVLDLQRPVFLRVLDGQESLVGYEDGSGKRGKCINNYGLIGFYFLRKCINFPLWTKCRDTFVSAGNENDSQAIDS